MKGIAMQKNIFYFTLFFFWCVAQAHPFKQIVDQQNNLVCYLYDHDAQEWNDQLSAFENAALHFEHFLTSLINSNKPIIIRVPAAIDNVSTMSETSHYTESARVAMAWASAFNRFESLGNLDVRIVKTASGVSHQSLISAVKTILSKDTSDYITMYQRVYTLTEQETQSANTPEWKLIDVDVATDTQQPHVYQTNLPQKKREQKTYLVTGGAGFIGSHLCKRLLNEGHHVIALDNCSCCTTENIASLLDNPHFYFIRADVTQPFCIETPIDCVIHLASIPSPKYYYALPRETLLTGLIGTKNTLQIAIDHNARYVFASTSEVYGDPEESPQREEYCGNVDPIGMRSQYDQSKRGAETLIKLYTERYGIDARIARIFNTYGPGMQLNDGRVITNFMQAYLQGTPLTIHGDGNQTRSFAYVSDTVEGIYKLVTSDYFTCYMPLERKICNIGTPEEHTINQLAALFNTVLTQLGKQPVEIKHVPQIDITDPKKRLPDISRAQNILGFEPSTDLIEGLMLLLQSYFLYPK